MPELPEVETTTRGLQKTIVGLTIADVWTDLSTKDKRQSGAIANPKYFITFRKEITGKKVLSVERRAKNILINLNNNKTILAHMKMTGHFLYGNYKKDPMNRFIHFKVIFNNGKELHFSDTRKFGKITLLDTKTAHKSKHLNNIGPEPLERQFTINNFKLRILKKPKGKIKTVLMDQSIIAGIGNIYSDEILWRTGVNPERKVLDMKDSEIKLMFNAMKEILAKGIDFGGDSMSDYRNIHGLPGKFQLHHQAYRRTGEECRKNGCVGIIKRKVVGGRSAHFCSAHQR